jgi:Subtilisin inhibitor-like
MAMKPKSLRVTAASGALAAGFGLLAAGCGGTTGSPHAGGQVATNHAASAKLQVLETVPGGQARHWSLRCNPASGTMPDAAVACRLLRTDATILHPLRVTHIRCVSTVPGARTFTITGTWHGSRLHEVVADGGCDLRRYSMMAQIFY